MNKGITVSQLSKLCVEQLKKGNGNKHILIPADDEANCWHTLFYGFQDDLEYIEYALEIEHDCHRKDEVVLLG